MSQNFMQSKLPPIYNQKETVRQHLISYLIENLQVPKAEINVEQSLTYYDTNFKTSRRYSHLLAIQKCSLSRCRD